MANLSQTPLVARVAHATLNCDRRILYAVFAVLLILLNMQLLPLEVPIPVTPGTRGFFDAVESVPPDKLVLIDNDWGAGNYAECAGQYEGTLRHCFARGLKVGIITWTDAVDAQRFSPSLAKKVAEQMGKTYGEDYVVFAPMTRTGGATIAAMAKDIPGTIKGDAVEERPVTEFPAMKNVENIDDVGLICRFAYMWESTRWIGFVQGPYGTKFVCGAAAITSSTAYPFLDAGQMSGLLDGASGAAQYEQLVEKAYADKIRHPDYTLGEGTRTARVQSFAAAYVVLAVILGNIAFLIDRHYRIRREAA